MEKTARKPSADPTQERLRANKAAWNKEVSAFINDLIHFKKLMNGWPSKFFKERSRITQPLPSDPATIIGSLAGDFQEIATRGNGIIEEQLQYSKNRRQRQPKPVAPAPGQTPQAPTAPAAPEAPKAPDLAQQIQKGLAASEKDSPLVKLAAKFEDKYELEAAASNPFTRFITRLFTPKIGFGEGARIRRLRMTMLENCVKALKELKKLHKEIVKSSKGSITNSHQIANAMWSYWNTVNRLFYTYRAIRPGDVKDSGGQIEDLRPQAEREAEKGLEKAQRAGVSQQVGEEKASALLNLVQDFNSAKMSLGSATNPGFHEMATLVESILLAPAGKKAEMMLSSDVMGTYARALKETNAEFGTSGSSFMEIAKQVTSQKATKQAQLGRGIGKLRHQLVPGATSGQRLEIYNLIAQVRKDLDAVMDLLEKGFDQDQLTVAVNQVNRGMTTLRTMIRALYHSEVPQKSTGPFMF